MIESDVYLYWNLISQGLIPRSSAARQTNDERSESRADTPQLCCGEFHNETYLFNEIIEIIKIHPDFKRYELRTEPALQLLGFEIYPDRREIYRDQREISLTAKEFDILCLLVANQGRAMTYGQICEQVWGDYAQDIVNNTKG